MFKQQLQKEFVDLIEHVDGLHDSHKKENLRVFIYLAKINALGWIIPLALVFGWRYLGALIVHWPFFSMVELLEVKYVFKA